MLAAALMTALSGCATTAPRTELQERVGQSGMSAGVLRVRVRDLARRLPGMLEMGADDIAEHSDSAMLRLRMLEFKANAVPTLQAVLFQPDPVAALVDAWALLAQLQDAIRKHTVGAPPEQVDRALRVLTQAEAEVESLAKEVTGQEDLSQARARVHHWAAEHPLTGPIHARESTAPLLAELTDLSRLRPLGAAAVLLEDTRDLVARVDLYASSLPRQARWQAELAAAEMASAVVDAPALREAMGELNRTVDILDRFGGLADNTPTLVARERTAVLDALHQERLAVQDFITGERQAVLVGVGQERAAVLNGLHAERIATLQQLDGLAVAWTDHAFDRATRLVDRVFLWLLGLIGLALVGALVIAAMLARAWRRRA
ncbi:chemotaxis protein [Myxococcus sp. RHST-1-4]|nr:chemotaxis protein [Myxococcus sp. RHSTA-1-4]